MKSNDINIVLKYNRVLIMAERHDIHIGINDNGFIIKKKNIEQGYSTIGIEESIDGLVGFMRALEYIKVDKES